MEVTPRPAAVPRWLQAADIATVLLTAAGLSILLFGGFRFSVAGVVISAHSALRLLLAAALVAAARHYFGSSPSLISRAAATMRRFLGAESVRAIGPAFIWSRVGVLVTAYFAVISVGYPALRSAFDDVRWTLAAASLLAAAAAFGMTVRTPATPQAAPVPQ